MIERIHEVTGRLTTLVDQILDVTHLDAVPVILERAPTSLAALIARLRGDLAAANRDVRLDVDVPADLPPLDVDGARIGQVLENLVGNAAKYGTVGAPIRIVARVGRRPRRHRRRGRGDRRPRGGPRPGPGAIPPRRQRARVADPGTGLGLTICRRLVEAHGGRLVVGDRLDGRTGTRVAFDLPLAPARPRPGRPAPTAATGEDR